MRVEWHGQSAFSLEGADAKVFVDPFGDMTPLADRGRRFEYPPIEAEGVDLVLVTHEHLDHNGVSAIGGDPTVLRATAGRHESPIGEVVGVPSEHDPSGGTERGPNTIFVFELDGVRVAHFGDFGQSELRPEQREAIGEVDMLLIPVGGGLTIGASQAAKIVEELEPRWVVPTLPHAASRLPRDRRRVPRPDAARPAPRRVELRHRRPARGRAPADRGAGRAVGDRARFRPAPPRERWWPACR